MPDLFPKSERTIPIDSYNFDEGKSHSKSHSRCTGNRKFVWPSSTRVYKCSAELESFRACMAVEKKSRYFEASQWRSLSFKFSGVTPGTLLFASRRCRYHIDKKGPLAEQHAEFTRSRR